MLRERAESLDKYVTSVPSTSDQLDVLRIFVRHCLDMPGDSRDLVHGIHREVFDLLRAATPGSSLDATPLFQRRTLTERLLDAHHLPSALRAGLPDDVLPLLRQALDAVQRIRTDFSESFPIRTEEEIAGAREEMARGDGLELNDAFAEIAGCSKDEWLRRVAAHRAASPTA